MERGDGVLKPLLVLFLDLMGLYNDKITIEGLQILEIKAGLFF